MSSMLLPYLWPDCNSWDTAGIRAQSGCRSNSPHTCRSEPPQSLDDTDNARPLYTEPTENLLDRSHKLQHKTSYRTPTVSFTTESRNQRDSLTFASWWTEAEEVDLTALAVLTCDPRLTLTLTTGDVTLTVRWTNRVAVTPEQVKGVFTFRFMNEYLMDGWRMNDGWNTVHSLCRSVCCRSRVHTRCSLC